MSEHIALCCAFLEHTPQVACPGERKVYEKKGNRAPSTCGTQSTFVLGRLMHLWLTAGYP